MSQQNSTACAPRSPARDEVRYWDGLAAAISPERALIGPEAAALIVKALDLSRRVDGISRLSPQATHIRSVCRLIAGDAVSGGQADVRDVSDSREWMTTSEAAEQLHCSARHANRLANDGALGPTHKVGNKRLIRRSEVAARAAERRDP